MSDERLSVPQDPEYFAAMGLATIAFARLELNAVWCCERLAPGYLQTIEPKKRPQASSLAIWRSLPSACPTESWGS
ncbi:hypothetical protein FHY11_000884 [Xanthomonas arboricola]|uniref:hypothetical protein n=1 Tax=Xanthomonas euroxanthea TaxID=2259622 RepID=UPI001FB88C62|nr:hypothetical protein [Xanthomonas euroxanthea]NIK07418.1 hypothetical protein [Xanthomonas euroxanthea]